LVARKRRRTTEGVLRNAADTQCSDSDLRAVYMEARAHPVQHQTRQQTTSEPMRAAEDYYHSASRQPKHKQLAANDLTEPASRKTAAGQEQQQEQQQRQDTQWHI
jgi:hypothetical protein